MTPEPEIRSLRPWQALLAATPLVAALLSLAMVSWWGRSQGVVRESEAAGAPLSIDLRPRTEIVIPKGATLGEVTDTLISRGLVNWGWGFRALARLRGDDRLVKYGTYGIPAGASWGYMLDRFARGEVVTIALSIPEGVTLERMAGAMSSIAAEDSSEVATFLADPRLAHRLEVPGSSVEGYLFPDTYRFAEGVAVEEIVGTMWRRQREVWTEARVARLDALGMSRHEILTLASIVEAEAARTDEMPRIASVYHNRLRDGWPLQADPTVLYALGGWRPRLLFAAIDSVADHPYNTYANRGLPPGPIGAPGIHAIDAALWPAEEPFMFFVAGRNGYHEFSRTLEEHNRAVADIRRGRSAEATTGNDR